MQCTRYEDYGDITVKVARVFTSEAISVSVAEIQTSRIARRCQGKGKRDH